MKPRNLSSLGFETLLLKEINFLGEEQLWYLKLAIFKSTDNVIGQ